MRPRATTTTIGALVVAGTIAVGCGGNQQGAGSRCPDGTVGRTTTNTVARPGAGSREAAVQAELQRLGLEATDDAIAAGVIASSAGSSPGTEEIEVQTLEGDPITMTLAPLDPGWAVEASRWCAPDPA